MAVPDLAACALRLGKPLVVLANSSSRKRSWLLQNSTTSAPALVDRA